MYNPDAVKTGDVIDYIDNGVHAALVLFRGTRKSFLLFATTNPAWNPRARLLTIEEYVLLGYPQRKPTYFAPVIRVNDFMRLTNKSFPIHRVELLQKEFSVKPELLIR